MNKNLIRRIEKLERTGMSAWQTNLRAVARKHVHDEEEFLRMVKGHERQLAQASGPDGRITWEGYGRQVPMPEPVLLLRLLRRARGLPELVRGEFG
jgi:hypothetical protein